MGPPSRGVTSAGPQCERSRLDREVRFDRALRPMRETRKSPRQAFRLPCPSLPGRRPPEHEYFKAAKYSVGGREPLAGSGTISSGCGGALPHAPMGTSDAMIIRLGAFFGKLAVSGSSSWILQLFHQRPGSNERSSSTTAKAARAARARSSISTSARASTIS
jgi:hypothetical protein